MGKLLLAFIAGVVFTSLAFSLFAPSIDEVMFPDETTAGIAGRDTVSVDEGPDAVISAGVVSENDQNADARTDSSAPASFSPDSAFAIDVRALPEDVVAREARLREEMAQAQAVVDRASSELQALTIGRMLAENPVVSPSPLPPEFDWVADQTYRGLFHERFQRELIDNAWSGRMETDLLQFVYDQPSLVERYGPPTIRCHTIRCEVLFTTASGNGERAQADARALFEQSLELMPGAFDCVQNNCWAGANNEGGTTTIFLGMSRSLQKTQSVLARASE